MLVCQHWTIQWGWQRGQTRCHISYFSYYVIYPISHSLIFVFLQCSHHMCSQNNGWETSAGCEVYETWGWEAHSVLLGFRCKVPSPSVAAIATFLLKTTFEVNLSCSKHLQTYHVHRMTLQSYIISKVDFAHQGLFLRPSTGYHTAARVLGRLGVAWTSDLTLFASMACWSNPFPRMAC